MDKKQNKLEKVTKKESGDQRFELFGITNEVTYPIQVVDWALKAYWLSKQFKKDTILLRYDYEKGYGD